MDKKKYYIKFYYGNDEHTDIGFNTESDLNEAFEDLTDSISNGCEYSCYGDILINLANVLTIRKCVE